MPPRTSWRNLLPGLLALAIVVTLAIGVIVFAGVGRAGQRGDTMRLFVLTNQAHDVIGGTEVWLVGQQVGTVKGVGFRSPDVDTAMRVVLELSVRRSDAGQIRHDSRAQIRTGGTIIGPAIVYLTAGTPRSPAVTDDDTLRAQPLADAVAAGGKLLSAASQEVGPLLADARIVMAHLRGQRTVVSGSLTEEHDGEVALLRGNVARLRDLFAPPRASRDALASARTALARADSIRALLNSPATSLGRFRRDSTLGATVDGLRAELARMRERLASVDGSVGRFSVDSAMTRSIADVEREMQLLFDDIRRRPGRYIAF